MTMMRHPQVLQLLASIYKPHTYLELGLYQGEAFNAVRPFVKRAIGVDTKKVSLNGEVHCCTTDEFFKSFEDGVDMVFIDADHRYESAKKDFENCLSRLNNGGIILIHDADPVRDELFDFGYCGDSYRLVDELEKREDINIVALPVYEEGLCIITKKQDTRTHRRQ